MTVAIKATGVGVGDVHSLFLFASSLDLLLKNMESSRMRCGTQVGLYITSAPKLLRRKGKIFNLCQE